jgi:integrase/recombinase XerD
VPFCTLAKALPSSCTRREWGGLASLDTKVIDAFVATLAGYQAKTVEQKLCAVQSFLRFAANDGLIDGTVLAVVPAAKSTRQARIPSVGSQAR